MDGRTDGRTDGGTERGTEAGTEREEGTGVDGESRGRESERGYRGSMHPMIRAIVVFPVPALPVNWKFPILGLVDSGQQGSAD